MTRRGQPAPRGVRDPRRDRARRLACPSSSRARRVAAPFALVLAVGLQLAREPQLDVEFTVAGERTARRSRRRRRDRRAGRDADRPARAPARSAAGRRGRRETMPFAVRLRAGEERTIPVRLECSRWGVYDVGRIEARARDQFRLVVWEERFQRDTPAEDVSTSGDARPEFWTPPRRRRSPEARSLASRATGSNTRTSATMFPATACARSTGARRRVERALSSTSAIRSETPTSCSSSTASRTFASDGPQHARRRGACRGDAREPLSRAPRPRRPGRVRRGPALAAAGTGAVSALPLDRDLLETGVAPTYIWRDVDVIPARILPPKALVIALTPLVDPRFVAALAEPARSGLRSRRRRDRPGRARRGGKERARAPRVPAVAARARSASVAPRTSRRSASRAGETAWRSSLHSRR